MNMNFTPAAALPGWRGPFYPSLLERMVNAWMSRGPDKRNGIALESAAKLLPGYVHMFRGRTTDGYVWFWLLEFRVHNGRAIVALPWSMDRNASGEWRLDRAPAVYIQGQVDSATPQALVSRLTRAFLPAPAVADPRGR